MRLYKPRQRGNIENRVASKAKKYDSFIKIEENREIERKGDFIIKAKKIEIKENCFRTVRN